MRAFICQRFPQSRLLRTLAMSLGLLLAVARSASATPITFSIDSTRSMLSFSGSAISGDVTNPSLVFPLQPQSFAPFSSQAVPDSLSSRPTGSMAIDLDWIGRQIAVITASIQLQDSGSWKPRTDGEDARERGNIGGFLGTSDLGGLNAVFRDVSFAMLAGPAPVAWVGGEYLFDGQGLDFNLLGGRLAWMGIGPVGPLFGTNTNWELDDTDNRYISDNLATQPARLHIQDGLATLTIPISARFYMDLFTFGGDTPSTTDDLTNQFFIDGVIVATANNVVPEPGTLALFGIGFSALAAIRLRRYFRTE